MTLTSNAVFQPECTTSPDDILLTGAESPSRFTDFRDPFFASTIPQCYALAATTVIAYLLVIMLIITPRTFLHQGAVVLGRRGFTNGPSGSDAGIGIGGRPWLQKVAAFTVAISLSIATADTFKIAEDQYNTGIMDAAILQTQVEGGQQLKIIRVISDTFLWLAQAQTLIRLFPRQREKIIIKWTAFALITLDVLFSILNNFVYSGNSRPQTFVDAVPALAYLFQLALSLLYCAWVMYYSLTKKRYAFYHPQMRNICLVALLSLVSVLVPVVFFVLDVSKPTLAAWGNYVRWVGAAAASVVVWEWVERIEALERNDKKEGVLGREVFDGDEMLDFTSSSDYPYKKGGSYDDYGKGGKATGNQNGPWPTASGLANRPGHHKNRDVESGTMKPNRAALMVAKNTLKRLPPLWPTRPPPAATPVSRTDTASAESTVYQVRYHPISEATTPFNEVSRPVVERADSLEIMPARNLATEVIPEEPVKDNHKKPDVIETTEDAVPPPESSSRHNPMQILAHVNPFRRKTHEPPAEVSAIRVKPAATVNGESSFNGLDLRARIEDFAVSQADKFREKTRPPPAPMPLPRTVIPAPPRRRDLGAALRELEEREEQAAEPVGSPLHSHPSRTNVVAPSSPRRTNSITQRGALSFVTPAPEHLRPNAGEANYAITPMTSHSTLRTNDSPAASYRDGLPLLRIPAPPRRPRTSDS